MATIELPHGKVKYRAAGPEDSVLPPVVFVHGFLVNGTLWSKVADQLASAGIRSYAPDWPLGSHSIALGPDADQSPRGVARQVISFLEALDLQNVTLVGNDTGGAICQFLIDTDHSRVGRLVLTNCDAFDKFPPPQFKLLFKTFSRAGAIRPLLAPTRIKAIRHSPLGFGLLFRKPLDGDQSLAWVEPCLTDAHIREDTARFARAVKPGELLDVSTRLHEFSKPVLLLWGNADRCFKLDFARRLVEIFPDARLVEIEGDRTFVSLDSPERVAAEIESFVSATASTSVGG